MYYEFAISVPKSTAQTAPVTQTLKLAKGIIQRIEVEFPIGTQALTHCQLTSHNFGQLPSNLSGSFATDGFRRVVESPLDFQSSPYIVKATLWNDDDTYPHKVTIIFDIVDSKPILMVLSVFKGLQKMLKLMGIKG